MDAEQDLTTGWEGLKQIPPDASEFTANGKTYRIVKSVSFDRWEAWETLQMEVGLGRTFGQFMDGLRDAYRLCNEVATGKPVFAELAVLLRDMLVGSTLIGERQPMPVLKMCALFIVREGEDLRFINDELINSKIADWRAEGIDMAYFFTFALRSIPGFFEVYRELSRTSSEDLKERGANDAPSTITND